jgi:hypothetical protein
VLVSPRFVVPTQQRMRQLLKQCKVYFLFHSRAAGNAYSTVPLGVRATYLRRGLPPLVMACGRDRLDGGDPVVPRRGARHHNG